MYLKGMIGGAYYAYTWYTSPEHKIVLEERRDEKIISDLREIILLPSEKPTIYTIEDPIPLMQSQPFFAGSQEGDKLLIFTQIAKAIVYSPDREVIVNIGPVTAEPALEENVEGLQGTQNQDDSQQNVLTDEEVDNI